MGLVVVIILVLLLFFYIKFVRNNYNFKFDFFTIFTGQGGSGKTTMLGHFGLKTLKRTKIITTTKPILNTYNKITNTSNNIY